MGTTRYRTDIDGLRAVAVLAVLFAHAQTDLIQFPTKGHFGVDAFFVISGFLITGIIEREIAAGQFSLLDFYRRRVVRILPALLTMLVLVIAAGMMVLLVPVELRELGHSGAAAAGFVSNLYFWSGVNYFAPTRVMPFLHTWSLGVEEQFYLLFPLFMLLLARVPVAARRWIMGVATAGSLLIWWRIGLDHSAATFYLLPFRAWELGLGALVAMGAVPKVAHSGWRAALSWLGLALLLGSFVGLRTQLTACVGAALLLAYAEGGGAGRLLATRPMRWVGLASYSLYLWHVPMLEFGRYLAPDWTVWTALIAVVLSFVAAALSYRFVETPVRRRFSAGGRPGRIVAAGLGASLIVAVLAMGVASGARWLRPLPKGVAHILAFADYRDSPAFDYQFGPERCRAGTIRFDAGFCLAVDPKRRNIIVLGDSHAAHLWRAIAERFPGDRVMQANSTDCRPLLGGRGGRLCREMFDTVMRDYVATGRVQAVVLAASWDPDELDLLAPTIAAIRSHGVEVLLVGRLPVYTNTLPGLIARAQLRGDPGIVDRARIPGTQALDARMRAIAGEAGVRYYSLYDQECPAGQCRVLTRGGDPMRFDHGHLTMSGARELVQAMPRP